jgi:hypothetical protein
MMRNHVSLEDIALLDADALKPRKAAKVRSHLAHCADCSQQRAALGAVPNMLASASSRYEPMPENLSSRVDSALASESAQRLANQPGTEAARGTLPARSRKSGIVAGAGRGWRMPSLSAPTVRALATAGAVAVVVGGGVGIATQLGGASSSSSAPAAGSHAAVGGPRILPPHVPALTKLASVSYGHGSSARRIEEVSGRTNFTAANMKTTVNDAVRAEKTSGDYPSSQLVGPSSSSSSLPTASDRSATVSPTAAALSNGAISGSAGASPTPRQLAGCLNEVVAPGQKLQLLERATFDSQPATIIVSAAPLGHPEHVWVVGNSCSSTHEDLLFQGTLPNDS